MFSSSMYFLVLFLAISQVSSSRLPSSVAESSAKAESFSFVDSRPRFPPGPRYIPPPTCNPQYVVIPQYIKGSGSIFANEPRVTVFTNAFIDAVYSSNILRRAFDLSDSTAEQYADFVVKYTKETLTNLGLKMAPSLAEFAARCIAPNFDVLTMPVVARAYANMVANFLFVDGDLTLHNAEDLAWLYAQSIVDSAKTTLTSDPLSKYPSLANGYSTFMLSYVEYSDVQELQDKSIIATIYVGNEWCVAAVNYRWQ